MERYIRTKIPADLSVKKLNKWTKKRTIQSELKKTTHCNSRAVFPWGKKRRLKTSHSTEKNQKGELFALLRSSVLCLRGCRAILRQQSNPLSVYQCYGCRGRAVLNLTIPRVLPMKPNNFRRSKNVWYIVLIYKLPFLTFSNLFYRTVIDTVMRLCSFQRTDTQTLFYTSLSTCGPFYSSFRAEIKKETLLHFLYFCQNENLIKSQNL